MVACSEDFDELRIPEMLTAAHCRRILSGQGREQRRLWVYTQMLRRRFESVEDLDHNLSGSHLCDRLTEP